MTNEVTLTKELCVQIEQKGLKGLIIEHIHIGENCAYRTPMDLICWLMSADEDTYYNFWGAIFISTSSHICY